MESDTIPIVDTPPGKEDEAKPLALAKTFDSFDATMRLMAQTGEIDEFKDYITQTQKMRAYKGKIEATSPLAAQAQREAEVEVAKPAPTPAPTPRPTKSQPRPMPIPQPAIGAAQSGDSSNLIMISAIVMLVLAAIGLLVALVIR